jgi:hypothetical protein
VVETSATYAEGTAIRGDRCDIYGNKKQTMGTSLEGENATLHIMQPTLDPCFFNTKANKAIDIATTTVTRLVTGVASNYIYICALQLHTASTQNIAILSGTTTTTECDTGAGKVFGGSTAATGWNWTANDGQTFGAGIGTVGKSAAAADHLCIVSSSTGQISGNLTYVIAP